MTALDRRTDDAPTRDAVGPSSSPAVGDRGAVPRPAPDWRCPGYAAAAVAFTFAAVSFYWGVGGRAGLSTLGGSIEEMALARDPAIVAMVWATFIVKVLGGLLALALVQPWGRRLPRRWLLLAAWSGAVLLTVYGVAQVTSVALVAANVITPSVPPDPTVLQWRLLLWEPWFLLWGGLLGLTAWSARRRELAAADTRASRQGHAPLSPPPSLPRAGRSV